VRLFCSLFVFFFQAEDGIRDFHVTGVQTCALPIWRSIWATQIQRIGGGPGRCHHHRAFRRICVAQIDRLAVAVEDADRFGVLRAPGKRRRFTPDDLRRFGREGEDPRGRLLLPYLHDDLPGVVAALALGDEAEGGPLLDLPLQRALLDGLGLADRLAVGLEDGRGRVAGLPRDRHRPASRRKRRRLHLEGEDLCLCLFLGRWFVRGIVSAAGCDQEQRNGQSYQAKPSHTENLPQRRRNIEDRRPRQVQAYPTRRQSGSAFV